MVPFMLGHLSFGVSNLERAITFYDAALAPLGLIRVWTNNDAGGSYVAVRKYLHKLTEWNSLPTSDQEGIIGRTKLDNVELADSSGRKAHKTLTTIVDSNGNEHDILRDNMPFGRPGQSEFGTYFIGYARNLWVIEKMLSNMFIGVPEGQYDRILDFSTASTGTTFFLPSNTVLETLGG